MIFSNNIIVPFCVFLTNLHSATFQNLIRDLNKRGILFLNFLDNCSLANTEIFFLQKVIKLDW
jgi:hypothetical protein